MPPEIKKITQTSQTIVNQLYYILVSQKKKKKKNYIIFLRQIDGAMELP